MELDTKALKALLADGHSICNVGTWTPAARAWVRRAHRRGDLIAVWSGYPDCRDAYIAA